jgi:hypothetical protein
MLHADLAERLNGPRPWARVEPRPVAPAVAPLIDLLSCFHEASHAVFAYRHSKPIHDAAISRGGGGGQFRHHPDARDIGGLPDARAGEIIGGIVGECDEQTSRSWRAQCVGYLCGLFAQRRYGAQHPAYDDLCSNDIRVVHFVLDRISGGNRELKARYLRQIEREAEEFVDVNWNSIERLANELYRRGQLDEREIKAVLERR